MDNNELINRIGYIRDRANLSARKLSMEIGKNECYIHRLETSKSFAPTFETLMDILDVCNTTTEEFFYYNIPAYKQDKEILNLLETASPEKKNAIITLLKIKKKRRL